MDRRSKEESRQIVSNTLNQMSDSEYFERSRAVYKSVARLLAGKPNAKKVLLFSPLSQWREVDLTGLEGDFKKISFDYVATDQDAPLPNTEYDIIFVPLYGFTDDGYRLGHGGGWYDKFLATQPGALKVGVGLEVQRINFISEPHDVPMDIVATEVR